MRNSLVIGDADGLIAFINPQDASNKKANHIISFLEENNTTLIFPTTAIAEAITTLVRKHASPPLARQLIHQCKAGNLQMTLVDDAVIALAIELYKPQASQYNTFFDAIVAAVAKQQEADAIFSFDGWYSKIGLKLAGDLINKEKID